MLSINEQIQILNKEELVKHTSVGGMLKLENKDALIIEIVQISNDTYYKISVDKSMYLWSQEMFYNTTKSNCFAVGEKVKIATIPLFNKDIYNRYCIDPQMKQYENTIVTVKRATGWSQWVSVEENSWDWHKELLTKIREEKKGEKNMFTTQINLLTVKIENNNKEISFQEEGILILKDSRAKAKRMLVSLKESHATFEPVVDELQSILDFTETQIEQANEIIKKTKLEIRTFEKAMETLKTVENL